MCPADYRYPPSVFDRPAELAADVLYVAGGLYGNLSALDEIERLAAHERATVVFNGDFHWFDAEPGWFAEVARRVARHHAIRGNVETEIARAADIGAGCGCAYPASVDEDVVRRSNEILVDLRRTADALPGSAQRLAALPMHLVAQVGGLRVGIVHGDATGLAGWSFAHDALDDPDAQPALNAIQPGRPRRCVRFDPHLSCRLARFCVARGAPEHHQQRRCRYAEFLRPALRPDLAHRHHAVSAPAVLRDRARRRFHRCAAPRL